MEDGDEMDEEMTLVLVDAFVVDGVMSRLFMLSPVKMVPVEKESNGFLLARQTKCQEERGQKVGRKLPIIRQETDESSPKVSQ